MNKLEIRTLTPADWEAVCAFRDDWARDQGEFSIDETKLLSALTKDDFEAFVCEMKAQETEVAQENWSTVSKYYAFLDGNIVGNISCRWQIEKGNLLEWGGHIGYGVAPSYRGHHFARKMVQFALEEYRKKDIFKVMISAHENNEASKRTIVACGGKLENTVSVDGGMVCRYWIDLS